MRILMVVTDISFPEFSGGARRTLETARILKKMGHDITIFSNKKPEQSEYEEIEGLKVYRKKMIEFGKYIRTPASYFMKIVRSAKNNREPTKKDEKSFSHFESHLESQNKGGIKEKLKEIYRHQVPVHKLAKIMPRLPFLVRLIRKQQFDIIYERGPSYGLGVLSAKLTGRKSIIDFIDVMYWNWAIKHTDRILSYFTNEMVPSIVPRKKIDIVYTSVDEERFNASLSTEEIKTRYKIGKDDIIGLYVGAFYPWHGLENLVNTVLLIDNEKSVLPERKSLKFMLVGDGELFDHIKRKIEENSLEKYFILTGRVNFDEVANYVNTADFCLSLNIGDAIGLKTFEYLACEKPLIASNVDLVPVFFKDKQNIIMVNPENPVDLKEKISYILNNPDKSKNIGKNGRKLVEEKYTWTIHGKNIINSILKILNN